MKHKKVLKIFLLVFAVVVLIFGAWYYYFQVSQTRQIPVLSSYYNPNYRYSLAIPSDWSGLYSVTEIQPGNTAFVFTGDQKMQIPIFILYVMPDSSWNSQKNSPNNSYVYIAENGGNTYSYNIAVSNDVIKNLNPQYKDQFLKMLSEIKDVVKTIKFN